MKIEKWRWKMKRKKMKIFSARPKISNWYFLEYLNFADSKSMLRFFISFLDQRLQPFKVGPFWPFLAVLTSLWRAVTFDPKKYMKNLSTDLESVKFKYSKKYKFYIFGPAEKIFIFFLFIFHLHFFNFQKLFGQLKYSAKIILPTVFGFLV